MGFDKMKTEKEKTRELMIIINHLDRLYFRALRSLGTRDNAFFLLYALSDGNVYSQKMISEKWFISRTTLNTIVKEYAREGYLELISRGRKEKDIVLTEKGREFAESILHPIFNAEEKAFHDFPESALDEMGKLAERIEAEFCKIDGKR